VPVWDAFVRVTHWAVAILVVIELANEAGANPWHRYLGYAAAALVLARLAWGLVTRGEARLARMAATATEAAAYLRAPRAYLGHNPLGALMAFLLWTLILAVGISGWLTQLDAYWGEEWLQQLHEVLAYILGACALLHVGGVLVTSRRYRINLIAAMLTGKKWLPGSRDKHVPG
jgi:cytochrome b